MLIHTPNLRLLTCQQAHLEAIVRDPRSLGEMLGVTIADGWPAHPEAFPHALALLEAQPLRPWSGWWLYLILHPEERALVGCAGFKDAPDADGVVEIGFEIAPAHRKRGFGAEAVHALCGYAFTRPEVKAVVALSLPAGDERADAYRAAGMKRGGEAAVAQTGRVVQWLQTRQAFESGRRKAAGSGAPAVRAGAA